MTRSTRRFTLRKAATAAVLSSAALGSILTMTAGTAHAYEAKITKQDLIDAGAQRVTGGFVIGGRTYHCGSVGYCSIA